MQCVISGFRSTWGDDGLLLLWFLDCRRFEIVLDFYFVGIFTKFEVATSQTTFACFFCLWQNFPRRDARLSNQRKVSKKDKFRISSAIFDCHKGANCLVWKYFRLVSYFCKNRLCYHKGRKIRKKGKVIDSTWVYRATN